MKSLTGRSVSSYAADVKSFRRASESFLEETHLLFPQAASELGLHAYDAELGPNDPGVHARYIRLLQATLQTVEALPDTGFAGDDWLDRRGFLSMLRTELFQHATLKRWRNNPQIHCDAAIQSIFGLAIRNVRNLRKIRPAIESRLGKIPAFLGGGAACVREPVPLWTRLAVKSCLGVHAFLEALEQTLLPLSDSAEKTSGLFAGARAAFDAFAREISRKPPGRQDGFSVGREGFEFLIRERLGLPYSLPEAAATGRALVSRLSDEVGREAARFGKKPAREILEEAARAWQPASGSLLDEYRATTSAVRERFRTADLLTLPERERLDVLPVPDFLRHLMPTAAYSQPGPYERKQEGIFWVNDLGAQIADPEKRRVETRQHFGLELTCAHEGYPGHHVQFVIQNRHPSKLRRLFAHGIFYEGWTLWCEKMSIDHGIYKSPVARLMQLTDALWRAHRIVIDCGLHSGEMSFGAACRRLVDGVGFTAKRAEGDVNWYTSAPTVPMSYLLGRLELEKLWAARAAQGWTLKQFNDWILSFGAIPWSWIWQSRLTAKEGI